MATTDTTQRRGLANAPATTSPRQGRPRGGGPSGGAAVVVVALALAAPAAVAAPLTGQFSSPMGPLAITESADGAVTGRIVDPKNVCGLPKGSVVLNGTRLDDSVAGTLKTCRLITDTCAGFVEGDAILLITRSGTQLSGTAHFDVGACKTPVGEAISMKKLGVKPPPPKGPAPPKPDPQKAEALLAEAMPLIHSGQAEEARKRCQEATTIDPSASQAFNCIGITYFLRERYDEALEQYKKALETNPANRDVYYNIGCIYAVQNKVQESLDYLKLALLNGYVDTNTLATDADLKNLHGNPEFEKLKAGQID
jgi:hypothetical protein